MPNNSFISIDHSTGKDQSCIIKGLVANKGHIIFDSIQYGEVEKLDCKALPTWRSVKSKVKRAGIEMLEECKRLLQSDKPARTVSNYKKTVRTPN